MIQPMVWKYCGILLFGGLGSIARFGLTELVEHYTGKVFPYGTMLVNILGCLMFGMIWGIASRGTMSDEWRIILLVGFLGGFTTFSSFAFHNELMIIQREWSALLVNVLLQNVVGVAAVWVGVKVVS